ncbi:MAG TPA: electron transfer flavoprotein subunit alpha/FixB family protein [Dehalococcoidia bacterium]|nr:electron transfer flavoprotein subunit alpha/FixB family protein [Dehalococcoidia bacterium]
MAGNIWVLADHWRGQLSEITYELLVLGRELAAEAGGSLQAILLGHNVKDLAAGLGAADSVLYVDLPELAEPSADVYGQVLAQLFQAKQPQTLLVPLTNALWEVVGVLPAQLQIPFVNFCLDAKMVAGQIRARCLLYGGKMEATVTAPGPVLLGILSGARLADQGRAEKAPAVEEVAVTPPGSSRVRFKQYIEAEAGDVDITQQEVLVSVGRGIQTQDNIALAQELADAFGGAVSGSRPVIDQGWLPLSRQVGKSGASVKPKLYLACGISGAPEHVEGMRNAALIVAVNTDPQAPIFNVAHYGVVADIFEVLPVLTEEIRRRQASRAA